MSQCSPGISKDPTLGKLEYKRRKCFNLLQGHSILGIVMRILATSRKSRILFFYKADNIVIHLDSHCISSNTQDFNKSNHQEFYLDFRPLHLEPLKNNDT